MELTRGTSLTPLTLY